MRNLLSLLLISLCLQGQNAVGEKYSRGGSGSFGGGGATGTITLIDHNIGRSSGGGASVTTGSMNCTGANWVGVVVTNYGSDASILTVSSSPANTFSHTSNYVGSIANVAVYWAASASVNSSMTVTVGATGTAPNFAAIAGFCFSNIVSGAKDKEIGAGPNTASCQPGAQTPTGNGYLQITGTAFDDSATGTINSPFTLLDSGGFIGGSSVGIGSGYYLQPTAASLNPTWTNFGAVAAACIQVSFVP